MPCRNISGDVDAGCADLTGTSLGDEFVTGLAAAPFDCADLTLSNNQLSDAAVSTLCTAIQRSNSNQPLNSLALAYNCITSAGARALAALLNSGAALEALNLEGNHIDPPGAKALAAAVGRSQLRSVNVAFNSSEAGHLSSWLVALSCCNLVHLSLAQVTSRAAAVRSQSLTAWCRMPERCCNRHRTGQPPH